MTQRKPKRLTKHIALSSRQWAWEFLRFNAAYRDAYAEWMRLPDSVRNFKGMSADGTPLGGCPPETPMSYFDVNPSALPAETVSEWLLRTEKERESGWGVQASNELGPPTQFVICEWVDPAVSPLPKDKEHVWENFEVEGVGALVEGRHARAGVQLRPLGRIHELGVIVDVRMPMTRLVQDFKNAVLAYREKVQLQNKKMTIKAYRGKSIINSGGIYENYVTILKRLDQGESEDDVRHKETADGPRLGHLSPYIANMKTHIPAALEMRDGGYKQIIFRDDFVGELKKKSTTGKT